MRSISLPSAILAFLLGGAPCSWAQNQADAIYYGGDVVTIDDRQALAQAVAITQGKIVAVGSAADVMTLKGPKTKLIDLQGKCLLPGFVDGHGHCLQTGLQAASANLLPRPDRIWMKCPGIYRFL